jgi:hypothetical protein
MHQALRWEWNRAAAGPALTQYWDLALRSSARVSTGRLAPLGDGTRDNTGRPTRSCTGQTLSSTRNGRDALWPPLALGPGASEHWVHYWRRARYNQPWARSLTAARRALGDNWEMHPGAALEWNQPPLASTGTTWELH